MSPTPDDLARFNEGVKRARDEYRAHPIITPNYPCARGCGTSVDDMHGTCRWCQEDSCSD